MRISRRTSGGRGEYEISEVTLNGVTPHDLEGREIVVDFGDGWSVKTGTGLQAQGGKHRIRLSHGGQIHLHRQVAAALMMPQPTRAEASFGRGLPMLRQAQYAIDHIELESVMPVGDTAVRVGIRELVLQNASNDAEELGFQNRLAQVRQLWRDSRQLPADLERLVERHRHLVTAGTIRRSSEAVVMQLQTSTTYAAEDLGISYRPPHQDVLPDLIEAVGAAETPPAPPLMIDEIDPHESDLRRRTVRDWKRWANSRGAASARFRQNVRGAYNSTCIVCGLHYPATSYKTAAGVDAAHILPWAQYDLDVVSNGLCLCKQHHWAFDEGLLEILFSAGDYYVCLSDEMIEGIIADIPSYSIEELRQHRGVIPTNRLPVDRALRPNPHFLEALREAN